MIRERSACFNSASRHYAARAAHRVHVVTDDYEQVKNELNDSSDHCLSSQKIKGEQRMTHPRLGRYQDVLIMRREAAISLDFCQFSDGFGAILDAELFVCAHQSALDGVARHSSLARDFRIRFTRRGRA